MSNEQIKDFDCKRCFNRTIKNCPYLEKRIKYLCEGFCLTSGERRTTKARKEYLKNQMSEYLRPYKNEIKR